MVIFSTFASHDKNENYEKTTIYNSVCVDRFYFIICPDSDEHTRFNFG